MHRSVQAGRQAALLYAAAGALTLVNNYLPGSEYLDVATLNVIGVAAIALGIITWHVPWQRLPHRATLAAAPLAFTLIAVANAEGGGSTYSFAVYFVVVFVWIGISQPPGTGLLVAPLATAAYVIPLLVSPRDAIGGVSSSTVAIPVCVLVAETIARTVRRLELAQAALVDRSAQRERMTEVVADVSSVLDPEEVLPRICRGVRHLVGADAAGFVVLDGDRATISAVSGVPEHFVGVTYDVAGSSMAEIVATRQPLVIDDVHQYPYLMDDLAAEVRGLHTLIAVPSVSGGVVLGALYALYGEGAQVREGDPEALLVLAGHVAAAVANAEAHAALQRQQAHEQAVVAATADGMAVVGADGTVTSWNPAAERITGLPAAQAMGRPLSFPVPEDAELLDHRLPDGRWIEVLSSPLPTTGEQVVSFRDISKPKALEEAKDFFLATTSHELRTPLTVIKGFTSTLLRRWPELSPELRAESLAVVNDRTDALITLVDHLLLSAKAGAGRHSLDLVPIALGPLLEQAATEYGGVSERHPVTLVVDEGIPPVLGDATSIDQVLGLLLENAVKYSPDGGTIELAAHPSDGGVVVTVSDRGIGLKPGSEATLFDRFYQGERGDRRAFGGVGLGLHIVRTLVEAMGGTASARNREGRGAVFEVRLPAAGSALPAQRRDEEPAPVPLSSGSPTP